MKKRFAGALLFSALLHSSLLYIGFAAPKPEPPKRKPIKISLIRSKKPPKKKIIVEQPTSNNEKPKDSEFFSEKNNTVKEQTVNRDKPSEPKKGSPKDLSKIPLIPSVRDLLRNAGPPDPGDNGSGGGSSDFIPGVKSGGDTLLNTTEFKYASYFNRIKREVVRVWHPYPDWRREDPTGQIYGHIQKRTLLSVVLDSKGFVKEVKVYESSNIDFLDKNAIDAFWDCVQFPNPPSGLIKDGKVEFEFGFNVDFRFRHGLK